MSGCASDRGAGRAAWADGQQAQEWADACLPEPVRFWLYLPQGYSTSAGQWPLVVFMHGSGERGSDLDKVLAHGPPKHAVRGRNYPFILVSPQLADGRHWEPLALHALLGELKSRLRVDADRVIATGLSLGGMGAWDWAAAFPQDLAAIVPVCGYGDTDDACRVRHIPVRAYHGAVDTVVALSLHQASVDALRGCGGNAELIVYPDVGHDAWNPAYEDPQLIPWMLAQRRSR